MPQKFIQTIQFFNEKNSTRLSGKKTFIISLSSFSLMKKKQKIKLNQGDCFAPLVSALRASLFLLLGFRLGVK